MVASVAPLLAPSAAAIAPVVGIEAATGGSATQQLLKLVLAQLVADAGGQAVKSGLSTVAGATAPSEYSTATVGPNKSNYFIGASPQLAREQWESGENWRRALVGLPPITATDQVMDLIAARQEKQATSLSLREQALAKVKGIIAQNLDQMNRQYDLSIAGLQGGYKVENTKQQAIGEIEKQRVASEYGVAGGMLNSAITNVYSQVPYSDSPILRQIAVPV